MINDTYIKINKHSSEEIEHCYESCYLTYISDGYLHIRNTIYSILDDIIITNIELNKMALQYVEKYMSPEEVAKNAFAKATIRKRRKFFMSFVTDGFESLEFKALTRECSQSSVKREIQNYYKNHATPEERKLYEEKLPFGVTIDLAKEFFDLANSLNWNFYRIKEATIKTDYKPNTIINIAKIYAQRFLHLTTDLEHIIRLGRNIEISNRSSDNELASLVDYIKNGIQDESGNTYPFELVDYYLMFDMSLDELTILTAKIATYEQTTIINHFLYNYYKFNYPIVYTDIALDRVEEKTITIIHTDEDENPVKIIIGKNENEIIRKYLNDHNIPINHITYNEVRKRLAYGRLNYEEKKY